MGIPRDEVTDEKYQEMAKIAAEDSAGAGVGEGVNIDPDWLSEALGIIKWSEDTTKSWLATKFRIDARGDLKNDVLPRLTREQAQEFITEVQNRLANIQMNSWE